MFQLRVRLTLMANVIVLVRMRAKMTYSKYWEVTSHHTLYWKRAAIDKPSDMANSQMDRFWSAPISFEQIKANQLSLLWGRLSDLSALTLLIKFMVHDIWVNKENETQKYLIEKLEFGRTGDNKYKGNDSNTTNTIDTKPVLCAVGPHS